MMSKYQKGFTLIEILLIFIVLDATGFVGYYVWRTTQANKTVGSAISAQTGSVTVMKITEMGIEFTVPSTFADITYNFSANDPANNAPVAGQTFADLSTTTINDLYNNCIANSITDTAQGSALGVIIKAEGEGKSEDGQVVLKQFNGYYIAYAKPQNACAVPALGTKDQALLELSAFAQDIKHTTVTAIQ